MTDRITGNIKNITKEKGAKRFKKTRGKLTNSQNKIDFNKA